jgi:methylphosphotriester-DNA--protein-cysteine methyltransferase
MLDYRTHPPPAALRDLVRCVWTLEGVPEPGAQRVLPDGCVEIVCSLAAPLRRVGESGALQPLQPATQLIGPTSRHVLLVPSGPVALVGARLRPGAAPAFVASSLAELRDQYAELAAVAGELDDCLRERLAVAAGAHARAAVMYAALARAARRERLDGAVMAVARGLERRGGIVTVSTAARRAGLAPRTLERRFQRAVGLGAKRLARLVRLQRVVAAGPHMPRLDSILAAGYCDQPHFLRDFRELTGTSPGGFFRRERNDLSAAFTEPESSG